MNADRARPETALTRFAGSALLASAVVAIVAIAFLVAMFVSFSAGAQADGERYGSINDVIVIVQYALMTPAIIAIHRLSRDRWPRRADAIQLSGLALVGLIAVGQGLLVTGVMTFEQQTLPLTVIFVLLAAWFVAFGSLVTSLGIARRGIAAGLLAATYVGYPIWALWLGRALRDDAADAMRGMTSEVRAG